MLIVREARQQAQTAHKHLNVSYTCSLKHEFVLLVTQVLINKLFHSYIT
jgi:hypothetical protein